MQKNSSKPKTRCAWVPVDNEQYQRYHDTEWGVPVHDDRKIFEFLVLESAQAGLSWVTVLKKRENYRKAFLDFDFWKVAKFTSADVSKLLQDPGLIRNRRKIEASINNAKCFLKVQEEFGTFAQYIWSFVDSKPIQNKWEKFSDLPTTTKESEALCKDLKQRGFRFLGPTVVYAHMQATGMVNDHTMDCFRYKEVTHSIRKTI